MKVAHLLCDHGVAGDMWLGALVDAGAPLSTLQAAVDALDAGARLDAATVRVRGVAAVKVHVRLPAGAPTVRTWAEGRSLLDGADLPAAVRDPALSVFRRLAEAEAAAHGTDLDRVHLHELGSLDTVVDIVGACTGVHALGLQRLTSGPVAVGSGTVATDHGDLPVPAPAVIELLRGFTVFGGGSRELATPTGAALLATLTIGAPLPAVRLTGRGRGASDPDRADAGVLTVLVGDAEAGAAADPAVLIEATVDDLSPELVPVVLDGLRHAGAHDAWATPVLMKKGRPGYTLTALVDAADIPATQAVLFRESTTIGVRWFQINRRPLPRRWVTVQVEGHDVRVKVAEFDGQIVTTAAEFDDVRAVAEALDRPAREVQAHAAELARHVVASWDRSG